MPGWLSAIVNFFGGGLSAIWHAFINVINIVLSIINGNYNRQSNYSNKIAAALNSLTKSFVDFVVFAYNPFVNWVNQTVKALAKRESDDYNRLVNFINGLSHKASQDITIVQDNLSSDIAGLIKWILSVLLPPILRDIATALAWIAKEGAYVFDLLTHLEKLADLILAFLFKGWLVLFRKYSKPIVTFVIRNWRSWLPGVLPVIEDIITSLF
jgi:hypothetical protein